jgi:hypothetical protein
MIRVPPQTYLDVFPFKFLLKYIVLHGKTNFQVNILKGWAKRNSKGASTELDLTSARVFLPPPLLTSLTSSTFSQKLQALFVSTLYSQWGEEIWPVMPNAL